MRVELTPEGLDHYARTYYLNEDIEDVDIEELAQRHSVPMILDAVGPVDRLLEMGYGTGLITRELLAAGVPVEVLEGSPALRDHALEAHPDLAVHLGMFETFTPEEPYDAVLALHVLEHVDQPSSLVQHMITWLRPGGALVVVTPNARSIHRLLGVAMGIQDRLEALSERDLLVGHQRVYDLESLKSEVEAVGLKVTGEFGYFVKPLANSQMLGWPESVLDGLNAISREVPADLCANIGIVARRS